MTTQSKAQLIMDHLLGVVFDSKPDTPIAKALEYNGYVAPEDFLMEKDDTLEALTYEDDKGFVEISKQVAGLLKTFKQFVAHHNTQGPPFKEDDWIKITRVEFHRFRSTYVGITIPVVIPSAQQSSNRPLPPIDLVGDFKCGIKRDASQFPILKDDAAWD